MFTSSFAVWCAASLLLRTLPFSFPATSAAAAFASRPRRLRPRHDRRSIFTTVGRRASTTTTTTRRRSRLKSSPLEDEPWEDDDSYWDMLRAASKDPETFDRFVEESTRKKRGEAVSPAASSDAPGDGDDAAPEGGKGGYVPIEEWDEQRRNGENMSKEERLQWECQRRGDGFQQNEILRQNLKSG